MRFGFGSWRYSRKLCNSSFLADRQGPNDDTGGRRDTDGRRVQRRPSARECCRRVSGRKSRMVFRDRTVFKLWRQRTRYGRNFLSVLKSRKPIKIKKQSPEQNETKIITNYRPPPLLSILSVSPSRAPLPFGPTTNHPSPAISSRAFYEPLRNACGAHRTRYYKIIENLIPFVYFIVIVITFTRNISDGGRDNSKPC